MDGPGLGTPDRARPADGLVEALRLDQPPHQSPVAPVSRCLVLADLGRLRRYCAGLLGRSEKRDGDEAMMLSIIVPAHDEESVIAKTVAAAGAAGRALGSPYEVIVVDDASADRTGEIARELGATVVRIEARQIAVARNAGATAAHGDLFLFLDADTLATPQSVRAAVAALGEGAVAGGAAVTLDEPVPRYARSLVRVLRFLYRRLHLASGCFLFCSREAFEAVGGFDETLFAAEEIHMSRALGRQGPVVMLREIVVTSGRKVRTHSAWAVLGTLARLTLTGKRGLRDRSRLGLWYGPRRSDPAAGRDRDG